VGDNGAVIPCDNVTFEVNAMTPVRRIAAAALVAALGLGFVGVGVTPASALDTTWGGRVKGNN
jgi:hypothetical protein